MKVMEKVYWFFRTFNRKIDIANKDKDKFTEEEKDEIVRISKAGKTKEELLKAQKKFADCKCVPEWNHYSTFVVFDASGCNKHKKEVSEK